MPCQLDCFIVPAILVHAVVGVEFGKGGRCVSGSEDKALDSGLSGRSTEGIEYAGNGGWDNDIWGGVE